MLILIKWETLVPSDTRIKVHMPSGEPQQNSGWLRKCWPTSKDGQWQFARNSNSMHNELDPGQKRPCVVDTKSMRIME